jgi:FixJ family two-component response regulator
MTEAATQTIYVIDDDPSVRRSVARLLRSAGLAPRLFEDAEQFLAVADQLSRGCVVLDLTMPKTSGLELQQRLHDEGIDLPIIVVSARDDGECRREASELGASFFFRKPVDGQALLDAIAWLNEPRGAERRRR